MSALNFGQLSIGLGIGFSSILIPQLKDVTAWSEAGVRIPVGVTEVSWIVSLVSIGQVGGAIIGGLLASGIGRKGECRYPNCLQLTYLSTLPLFC